LPFNLKTDRYIGSPTLTG